MSEESIFDELENSSEQPEVGGGFADWWDVDNEPDQLMGPIVEIHSAPEQFTDEGEVPDPIYTVVSTGRGGFDRGTARCTKTHVQVLNGLRDAEVGDLVNLKHTGLSKTENGNVATDYEIGRIPQDVWEDSGQADDIQELIDNYPGQKGDNRMTEPYSESTGPSPSSSPDSSSSGGSSELDQACDFLEEVVVEMQGGSMPVDNANKMLHEVRDFSVDVDEVAEEMGWTIEDDTVKAA